MQILNTQGREGGVEAPLSPASSLEAANSPTAATTANSIDGQEDGTMRPTPSPPHPACLKSQGMYGIFRCHVLSRCKFDEIRSASRFFFCLSCALRALNFLIEFGIRFRFDVFRCQMCKYFPVSFSCKINILLLTKIIFIRTNFYCNM